MRSKLFSRLFFTLATTLVALALQVHSATPPLTLRWADNYLTIEGADLPGRQMKILYLEAYCRPHSQTNNWNNTVIGHQTRLVSASPDGTRIQLQCTLKDGVVVDHVITAKKDEVDFRLTARNPTTVVSDAHWGQPCIRVGDFTGLGDPRKAGTYDYLKKSFVFQKGELVRMPTPDWATSAVYTPGQVWGAPGVPRQDLNPRPVNPNTPSSGLIGCFSKDEKKVFATAFEPYQELFQGVITCLHSDFRIGGLKPGQTRKIRGKIYLVPNDIPALLKRYRHDFPEHAR